jgi:hypothetical protein
VTVIDSWHRRWLSRQLEYGAGQDDFTFSQVETADGWSGWVAAEVAAGGRVPGGLRRALHSWHVRWAMSQMDALVARGEYFYCEEGDAIAMRPQTERP